MQRTLLLSALLLLGFTASAQVVYVDADATGAGNGTSWADAYDDLTIALDSAAAGSELWIAAGTYVTPDSSSFFIERELSLYGGFAGTETDRAAADPAANVTVLSGDVLGNDGDDFDASLMSDNNRVLVVLDTADEQSFRAMVSGLTITNGVIARDLQDTDPSLIPFAGGGLLALGRVDLSDVIFVDNRANFGSAAAFVTTRATGSTVDNIELTGNFFSFGGLLYSNGADSLRYADVEYTGTADTMSSTIIDAAFGNGFNVTGSTFTNVITGNRAFGGSIGTINVTGVRISDCRFDGSFADVAGGAIGLSHDESNDAGRTNVADEAIVENCTFESSSAGSAGGAIYLQNANVTVRESDFLQNFAPNGGAIYSQTTATDELQYTQVFSGNTFTGNSTVSGGGAILTISDQTTYEHRGNTYDQNSSTTEFGGGAIYHQGAAGVTSLATFTDNEFTRNASNDDLGGAVRLTSISGEFRGNTYTNNSGSTGTVWVSGAGQTFSFVNELFDQNTGSVRVPIARGGGIAAFLSAGTTPTAITIDSSTFTQNSVGQDTRVSGGGAIYVEGDAPANGTLTVSNSLFAGNQTVGSEISPSGGAILALNGVDVTINDSDFINNRSQSGGGAIATFAQLTIDSTGGVRDTIFPRMDQPKLRINRSFFLSNLAARQGGALEINNSSVDMRNSLLIQNALVNNQGSGGALIINGIAYDTLISENYLINNTFYGNLDGGMPATNTTVGSVGNAVALFQEGGNSAEANAVNLTIQNNAFFQNDPDEEAIGIETTGNDGSITVRSLGGNYFNSNLSAGVTEDLLTDDDIVNTTLADTDIFKDPLLDDITAEFPNLELIGDAATNPLVDAGTTGDLVPDTDFYGNDRDGTPDIGALELGSIPPTGVAEPIEGSGLAFDFFPVPAASELNIVNGDAGVRSFVVLLSDASGRLLSARRFTGERNTLPVAELPAGTYNLTLIVHDKLYSKRFTKL